MLRTLLLVSSAACLAAPPNTVFLESLTWTEVRDLLVEGTTSIIIPTGGTEQNGPHMVLGKHNFRIRFGAEKVARKLGKTLVAPVMTYVPEGDISPPTGHMRFPGTITLPEPHFRKLLEYAARSFQQHGFRDIIFLGDSGPNQAPQAAVAQMLNREWAATGIRVHAVTRWYQNAEFQKWLLSQGETTETIGTHAGSSDTSLLLAVDPKLVRRDELANNGGSKESGVIGDPTHARAEWGRRGIELSVDAAVAEIRELMKSSRAAQ